MVIDKKRDKELLTRLYNIPMLFTLSSYPPPIVVVLYEEISLHSASPSKCILIYTVLHNQRLSELECKRLNRWQAIRKDIVLESVPEIRRTYLLGFFQNP